MVGLPSTVSVSDLAWDRVPTDYNGWKGGGEFLLTQVKNGRYTWVIDTRKLTTTTSNTEYKLFIMAMDKAGNTDKKDATAIINPVSLDKPFKETFKVDQSRDYPVIDKNSLNPLPDSVIGEEALFSQGIKGTVSDADLFNSENRDKYVEIRFPSNDPASEANITWGAWQPITISGTYSSTNGGIDPSGAIVYKYVPAVGSAQRTYLSKDGIKYYQIRVTDEPVEGEKNFGKNPDLFMTLAPDKDNYPGYIYEAMPAVSKIFPDTGAYKFFVDATYPEIFFDKYDPAASHTRKDGTVSRSRPR